MTASSSQRSFSGCPAWPFTQLKLTLCTSSRSRSFSHRSLIEPRNSFELFEDSIASTEKTGHRYAYEKETDTIHRFFSNAEETEWHWCGSENQGKNSLNITKIPKDIKKTFTKEYGVKWKGR